MPAASAEKRARQRANTGKLLKTKPTAEHAVSTAQTPEIMLPSSQPTDSTPIPQSSTSPSSTSIDFETFVELADLDDVLQFCDAVASTREGRNLKLLWDRAFEAGLDQGRNEERDLRDEMYLRGKAMGIKEAEEAANRTEIDLYSHGIEKGRTEERSEWASAGHGPHCLTPIAILSDQIVQTESEPTVTATCDASIQVQVDINDDLEISPHVNESTQTPEPPPPAVPPQMLNLPPLNWADDSNKSLPITPLPPLLHQPRDLSVLRSQFFSIFISSTSF